MTALRDVRTSARSIALVGFVTLSALCASCRQETGLGGNNGAPTPRNAAANQTSGDSGSTNIARIDLPDTKVRPLVSSTPVRDELLGLAKQREGDCVDLVVLDESGVCHECYSAEFGCDFLRGETEVSYYQQATAVWAIVFGAAYRKVRKQGWDWTFVYREAKVYFRDGSVENLYWLERNNYDNGYGNWVRNFRGTGRRQETVQLAPEKALAVFVIPGQVRRGSTSQTEFHSRTLADPNDGQPTSLFHNEMASQKYRNTTSKSYFVADMLLQASISPDFQEKRANLLQELLTDHSLDQLARTCSDIVVFSVKQRKMVPLYEAIEGVSGATWRTDPLAILRKAFVDSDPLRQTLIAK